MSLKIVKRLQVSLMLAFLFLLVPANAGRLEDGSAALEKKQYKKAHALLLPLAKKGNVFAQYNVAVMYAKGLGVTKNDVEAVKWYKKAAEQGDANAQANLGLMYENGRGVILSPIKRLCAWFQSFLICVLSVLITPVGFIFQPVFGVR